MFFSRDVGVMHVESRMPMAELLLPIVPGTSGTSEVPATTQRRLPSRQPPGVGEAVVAQLTENYMIKKLNSEYFACLADALGQLNIVLAGRWIAGRMVVCEDNRRGILENGGFENLAGLCFVPTYVALPANPP